MKPYLPSSGSALDIGCNNGFFTFKMDQHGLVSLGVDASVHALTTTRLLGVRNNPPREAFPRLDITPETAANLPIVDVVVRLSVFQHLVGHQGLEEATAAMSSLASKTRNVMVF